MSIAALGAIGAIASAGGALYSGIATSQAASYQAAVTRNDALIANQNATRAIAARQQQAQNKSLQNAAAYGAIKVSQAANNIDTNTGSAVDLEASQRAKGQLDASTSSYNAQVQAYGYRTNAVSDDGSAGPTPAPSACRTSQGPDLTAAESPRRPDLLQLDCQVAFT